MSHEQEIRDWAHTLVERGQAQASDPIRRAVEALDLKARPGEGLTLIRNKEECVRAILAAIREPTEAMELAGYGADPLAEGHDCGAIYTAMIDWLLADARREPAPSDAACRARGAQAAPGDDATGSTGAGSSP